jgi:hypothetical protein
VRVRMRWTRMTMAMTMIERDIRRQEESVEFYVFVGMGVVFPPPPLLAVRSGDVVAVNDRWWEQSP